MARHALASFTTAKHLVRTLAAAVLVSAASAGASAALVTSSWSGNVTGHLFQPQILDAFPVGTAVSWQFTFDDGFASLPAGGSASIFAAARQPIDGWLQVGADRIELEEFGLSSIRYEGATGAVIDYRTQLRGTGPLIFPGGADFFGLFVTLSAGLSAQSDPLVGYAYHPSPLVTNYGYLTLDGMGRIGPAAVPVPTTAWLVLAALLSMRGTGARPRVARP